MQDGAPWRDLPECYGKWITVCRRFNRRSGNGAMERLFTALQEERIIAVEVRVLAMDSTSVKVHQHAAGAPLDGRARRVHGRAPAHGPRVRGGFHPTAGRVVRPDAGRAAQEEPYGPMGLRQAGVQGRDVVERVFNRMKHYRKAATRYDRLDATFLANLQLILIAIYLKNTAKNSTSVNTP
ncbi:transposase [Bifidobacterium longum]|uniref:transposase n=1 Tax=Bifidobacterium longum TaxID=216816 RepID=UPI00255CA122|nr:transposase [Bifidobacterium longum]